MPRTVTPAVRVLLCLALIAGDPVSVSAVSLARVAPPAGQTRLFSFPGPMWTRAFRSFPDSWRGMASLQTSMPQLGTLASVRVAIEDTTGPTALMPLVAALEAEGVKPEELRSLSALPPARQAEVAAALSQGLEAGREIVDRRLESDPLHERAEGFPLSEHWALCQDLSLAARLYGGRAAEASDKARGSFNARAIARARGEAEARFTPRTSDGAVAPEAPGPDSREAAVAAGPAAGARAETARPKVGLIQGLTRLVLGSRIRTPARSTALTRLDPVVTPVDGAAGVGVVTFPAASEASLGLPASRPSPKRQQAALRRSMGKVIAEAQRSPTALKDVIIVGGGFTGLMAALLFAREGIRVTLLEQREDSNLPIHFNVRQDFFDFLHSVDPTLAAEALEVSGVLRRSEIVDAVTGERIVGMPTLREPDGSRVAPPDLLKDEAVGAQASTFKHKRSVRQARLLLASSSVAQIWAEDLRRVLRGRLDAFAAEDAAAGRPPRVVFESGAQGSVAREADGRFSVTMQRKKADGRDELGRTRRVNDGPPVALGSPDLVYLSGGVNGPAREQAGIKLTAASPETRFIAASLRTEALGRSPEGIVRRRFDEVADPATGAKHTLRQIFVGHEKRARSWVLIEAPPYLRLETPEQIRSFYLSQAALVLEMPEDELRAAAAREGGPALFDWAPNMFTLQQNVADEAVAGTNLALGGDQVGGAHFLTSGGVMTALVPHMQAVLALIEDYKRGRAAQPEFGLARYGRWVREATLEWLRIGAPEIGQSIAASNLGAEATARLRASRRALGLEVDDAGPRGVEEVSMTASERALISDPRESVAGTGALVASASGWSDRYVKGRRAYVAGVAAAGVIRSVDRRARRVSVRVRGRLFVKPLEEVAVAAPEAYGFSPGQQVLWGGDGDILRVLGFFPDGSVLLQGADRTTVRTNAQGLGWLKGSAYGYTSGERVVVGGKRGAVLGFYQDSHLAVAVDGAVTRVPLRLVSRDTSGSVRLLVGLGPDDMVAFSYKGEARVGWVVRGADRLGRLLVHLGEPGAVVPLPRGRLARRRGGRYPVDRPVTVRGRRAGVYIGEFDARRAAVLVDGKLERVPYADLRPAASVAARGG
ncbi:MAG: FAD-dependent monooxygenase [Elusimicrobiota bacterium]|nr:FAD-dependent monooxygenase [Elusimicrobiota bacterium]